MEHINMKDSFWNGDYKKEIIEINFENDEFEINISNKINVEWAKLLHDMLWKIIWSL